MARARPISLTKLEGEVMLAVWDLAGPVRVRDVADALNARRDTALAYTTVQTMLTILKDKGIVEQVEGPGRAHLYRALVSREQALRMMTIDAAFISFDERKKGTIEPGKLADLAILTADPLTCPEDHMKDIRAVVTVVGGKIVYERPNP